MGDWQVLERPIDPEKESDAHWLARRHSERELLMHDDLILELTESRSNDAGGRDLARYVLTLLSGVTPRARDWAVSHPRAWESESVLLPDEENYPDRVVRRAVEHVLRVRTIDALLKNTMDAIHEVEDGM